MSDEINTEHVAETPPQEVGAVLERESVQPPQPINRSNDAVEELKHSIQLHIILMTDMTKQLGQFLLKLIDFIDDNNITRRNAEMYKLSYLIIETLAVFVHQSIDDRADKAAEQGINFPPRIKQAGDNLLVVIGKTRGHDDKIVAKNIVLRAIADALRELSAFTKAKYPTITDSKRNEL